MVPAMTAPRHNWLLRARRRGVRGLVLVEVLLILLVLVRVAYRFSGLWATRSRTSWLENPSSNILRINKIYSVAEVSPNFIIHFFVVVD